MRKLFHAAALSAAFALCTSTIATAQSLSVDSGRTPEASKIRTFFTGLNAPAGSSPSAVNFNSVTGALTICANADPALCKQWRVGAQDVVPYTRVDGSKRLFVIDTPSTFRSCVVGSPDISCEAASIGELTTLPVPIGGRIELLLNSNTSSEYACAYSVLRGLHCASAQHFQERSNALVFGHFTGDPRTLQALSLDRNEICEIGGTCRGVQGLGLLAGSEQVTSTERAGSGIDRSVLLGLNSSSQSACIAFFESETQVGFSCQLNIAASTGSVLHAFTVYGPSPTATEKIAFARQSGLVRSLHLRVKATADEVAAGRDRSKQLKELVTQAFSNAGGPMVPQKFKAAYLGFKRPKMIATLWHPPVYDLPPDDVEGPDLTEFTDAQDDWGYEGWSDMDGYYFWDVSYASTLHPADCQAVCDQNQAFANDRCDIDTAYVTGAGLTITVGATMAFAVTGPGAVGVGLTGLALTGTAAAATLAICRGVSGSDHIACSIQCGW